MQKCLAKDRTLSVWMLEEMTGINRETVRKILVEDLENKKVCSRFVPCLLTPAKKHQCPTTSVEFVLMTGDDDGNVLKRIVMGDESCYFMYNPERKCQSATWLSPKKPKAQKVRMQNLWVKRILTAFFHAKATIHHEFVLEKQTVNGKFYKKSIKRFIARAHRVRLEFQESGC
jgi:hypothetical protein